PGGTAAAHHPAGHPSAHLPARPAAVHQVVQLPDSVVGSLRSPTPLENPWLAAGVLTAGALLLAAWAVLAVRRRRAGRRWSRPLLTRLALGTAAGILVLAGTGLAVNSYAGYVPTAAALGNLVTGRSLEPARTVSSARPVAGAGRSPRQRSADARRQLARLPGVPVAATGSQIVQLRIGDRALGVPPSPTYVYLPPGYTDPAAAAVRYPVVYLIHGYPGQATDWLVAGQAQQVTDLVHRAGLSGPMIVVFPTANGGWLTDSECLDAVGRGPKQETYLTKVVVATVDATFRTVPTRAGRAVGGMSAGGFCALNLGLRHPDTYSVILSSMPYGDPGRGPLVRLLGGNLALFRANSPSWYVPRMRFTRPVAVFLDAGTDDPGAVATARTLARDLAVRGQYVALRLAPGLGHTWREARAELPYSLIFASQHLERAR
ncbi:MAG TPA: alpha/beta hydrolase-fold protein, partial [Mycobacteriales bacterium]|nr:alpha/beta hydrolase-fold protein [Mycobacteriales bacterium]